MAIQGVKDGLKEVGEDKKEEKADILHMLEPLRTMSLLYDDMPLLIYSQRKKGLDCLIKDEHSMLMSRCGPTAWL